VNRREFGALTLAAIAGPRWPGRSPSALWAGPSVNGERLLRTLRELGRIGRTEDGGVSRVAYGEADLAGREYVRGLIDDAGLDSSIDFAGNLIGRREGREPGLAPLLFGSHIDSVPDGGNYDGPVGSLGAIEVAATLAERGIRTRHPLEVVVFSNEEGGKTGSRAWIGAVRERELAIMTASGKTIGEGIDSIGGDAARLDAVRRSPGSIAGFVELHVEQGGVLDQSGVSIGVVQGIVGIKRWNVVVRGFANHAGTTPMDQRQDAMLGAARFIDAANRIIRDEPGRQVGTVGRIAASPGAPNVIPGEVTASLELRDLDMAKIDRLLQTIREETERIGRETGTRFEFDEFYISEAALTDVRFRDWVAESASDLGFSKLDMPSGAGHDAQSMAKLGPVGMIFVPSVGGVSHSPREYTRPEDVVAGADVLLGTVLRADAAL